VKKFLLSDTTIGIVLLLAALGLFYLQPAFLETIELKSYDARSALRQAPSSAGEIAIVAIDDDSIGKIGRWPWPRTLIASGIDAINGYGAKVIGLNILFTEPERNQGLEEIKNLQETLPALAGKNKKISDAISKELSSAQIRLDNDSKLLDSLKNAGNVVLPMYFTMGQALGQESKMSETMSSSTITQIDNPDAIASYPLIEGHNPTLPLDAFAFVSPGLGHVNVFKDVDGGVRSEMPVVQATGDFFPSFAVQIARMYLNIPLEQVKLAVGKSLSVGRAIIPLDATTSATLINFNGPAGSFPYYSFYDVLNKKVDKGALKGKIVLVGHMATGIADLNNTPAGHNFPAIEITANFISNILHQRFITRPQWAKNAELGSLIFIGLFVALVLPHLHALAGSLISLMLLAALVGGSTYFFVHNGYWLKISYSLALLAAGYLIIVSKRFLVTEKKKELVEAGAIETNKMLGLSFQGQGMLDMAFEKFRKCPVDEPMKELLYNLGLDFERKRQFNKAVAVYEHIIKSGKAFKNVGERIKQLKAASDGAVFGGVSGKKASGEGTVLLDGANAVSPTLGRYQVEKELGRGAMGTVYLGRDPKINRQVAIKTLRFDDEVDEPSTKAVQERFFREAESAGNLNHPNIIKIYDAGEDNGVSYIAMEFLEGEDLKKYTDSEHLLPLNFVMDYANKIALALDYAHQQGVIHRDIKPANIMLLKDGTLRITDFGIARIAASSKTATGTVLGTPSYMSPEQLAGKKVDGRSDLFSFGVMLYELLCGRKPFEGDSIATLMFKIANEKQPAPTDYKPSLLPCLVAVLDKCLDKNPDMRYQRGSEISADIQSCMEIIKNTGAA